MDSSVDSHSGIRMSQFWRKDGARARDPLRTAGRLAHRPKITGHGTKARHANIVRTLDSSLLLSGAADLRREITLPPTRAGQAEKATPHPFSRPRALLQSLNIAFGIRANKGTFIDSVDTLVLSLSFVTAAVAPE
jgi:hypothetical protein